MKLADMKIKQECAVCETKIWDVSQKGLKKNERYNEVDVMLNNDSKMTVGICPDHKGLVEADFATITKKTIDGWQEEVEFGVGNPGWLASVGSKLIVVGVA